MTRRTLVAAIALICGVASSGYGFAQSNPEGDASSPSETKTLSAIQVTATRIKSANMVTATPVVQMNAQQLTEQGMVTIGDVLQQMTITGTGLNTHNNNAGQMGSPPDGSGIGGGAMNIALRDLNPKRTLILVNGLRWINGSSGSGVAAAVDLNTIPMSAVERIDVLPNGASALYGADAIAGVINIITKSTQDGVALGGNYGFHEIEGTGTGQTYTGSASVGGQGERFRYFVDIEQTHQNPISSILWSGARSCVPGVGIAGCSAASPMGNLKFTDPGKNDYGGLCPDGYCNIVPNVTATPGMLQQFPQNFHRFTNNDRYNYTPDQQLMMMVKRTSSFASATYEITPSVQAYLRMTYTDRTSANRLSPTLIGYGPGACTPGSPTCFVSIDATNPYNPLGFTLDPRADSTIVFTKRFNEMGRRDYKQVSHMRYLNGGFTGNFEWADRGFNWDINFSQANNNATEYGNNVLDASRVAKALGPLDECMASPGCVPLNLFGGFGSITPEMAAYIRYNSQGQSHQHLGLVTANISGDVVELPKGWITFASGYERRNLSGSYDPDALTQQGINGVPIPRTSGSFHTDSVYLELNIPLLADLPGVKDLNLDVASRFDRYSTFGGTGTSQASLRWQPVDDLTLRATWGQGFRAPTIGELFGSRTFSSSYTIDPCNADNAARTPAVLANCVALGVPNLDTFHQTNIQIAAATGGNKHLKPEESRSLVMGGVYSPSWAVDQSWAKSLDFSLTYYRIDLKDTITAADAQTIVNRCMQTLDPIFCDNVSRAGAGQITLIEDTLQNLGSVSTSGFDIGMDWFLPQTAAGLFGISLSATYVKKYVAIDGFTGLREPRTVGVEVANAAIPRLRSQLKVNWARGPWSGLWTIRGTSALEGDCGPASNYPICTERDHTFRFSGGQRRMGATFYHDARLNWHLPTQLNVIWSAGVNNVFDRSPPACTTCTLGGYDATTYDLPGRYYYTSATLKF